MSSTELDLAHPLDVIREGLTRAIEDERARYAAAVEHLASEHASTVGRMEAALAALGDPSSNGHSQFAEGSVLVEPAVPEIDPTDTVVDLSETTMEEACLTVMGTRRGQVWKAEDLQSILEASGRTGKLSSVRACLSLAYRNGKVERREPGEYVLP